MTLVILRKPRIFRGVFFWIWTKVMVILVKDNELKLSFIFGGYNEDLYEDR